MNEKQTHTWKELKELRDQRQELLKKPFDSISFMELQKVNETISNYVVALIKQPFCEESEK